MDKDLADLLLAWLDGDVADERRHAVLGRLRDDAVFRAAAASELHLMGMLRVIRTADPRWLRLEDELGWSATKSPTMEELVNAVSAKVEGIPTPRRTMASRLLPRMKKLFQPRWVLAAAILAAIIGAYTWYIASPEPRQSPIPQEPIGILVRLNGPGWEGDSGPAEGGVVRTGSLALKGGSASIAYFNGVMVHLEGAAVVEFQSPNRVFCQQGKIRINAPIEGGGFSALAPGASVADSTAEFAMTVTDDRSDVMVFAGQAEVALLDNHGHALTSEIVSTGHAVRLDPKSGSIAASSQAADGFAGPIPSLDPQLVLAPEYAAAIRASRPASYWRFEKAEGGMTPNEIKAGSPLQLIGQAAPVKHRGGNHCLNFPAPTEFEQSGALSAKAWTPSGRDYAVECWAMPRFVRHSALIGLVADGEAALLRKYGILLELTAQPSPLRLPDRVVRAVHRFPVEQVRGINLFTPANYLPYRWQHLVLQRSGNRLELFVNGELAAVTSVTVDSPLPSFRTLLGALYARRDGTSVSDRPFVGLIDEVALYDHALSPADIAKHSQLGSSIRADD